MEQNMPGIAKKIWNIVRVALFMIRKGISKRKIIMDLNMMMKRGKLAGKALGNLMFHHHHHNHEGGDTSPDTSSNLPYAATDSGEYEFSCSSTPLYRLYFSKRKNNHNNINHKYHDEVDMEAVNKVLEMMVSNDVVSGSSPALPLPGLGFGQSPMPVRQLRITDSPYPVQNGEDDNRVDQEAEEFIKRFYSQLKEQKYY